jgi:hypothetical protein
MATEFDRDPHRGLGDQLLGLAVSDAGAIDLLSEFGELGS